MELPVSIGLWIVYTHKGQRPGMLHVLNLRIHSQTNSIIHSIGPGPGTSSHESPAGKTCHRLQPLTHHISISFAQSHTHAAQSIRHKLTMAIIHLTTPRHNLSSLALIQMRYIRPAPPTMRSIRQWHKIVCIGVVNMLGVVHMHDMH